MPHIGTVTEVPKEASALAGRITFQNHEKKIHDIFKENAPIQDHTMF